MKQLLKTVITFLQGTVITPEEAKSKNLILLQSNI